MRYTTSHMVEWLLWKRPQTTNGEDVEKMECPWTVGGNVN